MKVITYKCNCDSCERETSSLENSKWIEIGSEDNKLFINNHFANRKIITLSKYPPIHFCSPKCLTNYFLKEVITAD